jgi:hypothetical protein
MTSRTRPPYLLDDVSLGSGSPYLMNTSAKGRFGVLIELNGSTASRTGR